MASIPTPEMAQIGVEHVERSTVQEGEEQGGQTLRQPPHRTRAPSSRPRPVSMPPVSNTDAPTATGGQEQSSHRDEHRGQGHSSSRRGASRQTVRVIGNYSLGKTLGAGSMGKVKLAYHNQTGEKLAIKIVPRPSGSHNNTGNPTASFLARQAAKDASKEIRTVREAALSMILFHPYICGTREIIPQANYHYIVFQFVNGGQMLDYIISHGRLRERVARKFARQIGSALEYCHKNNVVHRDLKIENILISESGNIKIIDFGLSNLYNPALHLQTFCGSLYFAAPELLNAKAYTGPEVDIWSFGVVLYVLVCGKVPFDDQHMPALHAKIKRGIVDYPHWLSVECKHILSRMLVVNPSHRAPLSEVLRHAWMLRGYPGPPDPHLLHREPLRPSDIDQAVIKGMIGFEFGTPNEIEKKLREVLETDTYKRMVEIWERKQHGANGVELINGESPSSSLTAINGGNSTITSDSTHSTKKSTKRFSGLGLDFYRRKLFPQGNSPPNTPSGKLPLTAIYGPQTTAVSDSNRIGEYVDPCFGFHPLISIYFLVREKMDRERVYGPHFASSQLDLNPPQPATPARTEDPVALNVPSPTPPPSAFKSNSPTPPVSVVVAPPAAAQKPDYNMPLPRIPAPEPSHQAGPSYDSPVPKSPATPTHPQARTIATDLPVALPRKEEATPHGPPSSYAGMPAAPKPAEKHQHRRSTSLTSRAGILASWAGNKPSQAATGPRTAGPEHTTFDEKVEIEPRRSEQHTRDEGRTSPNATSPPSAANAGGSSIKRITTLLGSRLSEDSRKTLGRRGSLLRGAFSLPRHSVDVASRENEKEGQQAQQQQPTATVAPRPKSQDELSTPLQTTNSLPVSSSASQPASNLHRRAGTVVDSHTREGRHIRRGSLGGGFALSAFSGTLGRRPRTAASTASKGKAPAVDQDVKEDDETEEKPADSEGEGVLVNRDETHPEHVEDDGSATERETKPLYLKGLFSVATTTTRPVNVIKNDIRAVLDRMQIQYREIRGGFECIHAPSIDLNSIQVDSGRSTGNSLLAHSQDTSASSTIRRGVVRKASKLSFGTVRRKDKAKETDYAATITSKHSVPPSAMKEDDKDLPSRPSGGESHPPVTTPSKLVSPSGGSSSFFNVPPATANQAADGTDETVNGHTKGASIDKDTADSVRTQDTEGDTSVQDAELPPDLKITAVPADETHGSPTTPTALTPSRDKFLPPIPRDFGPASPVMPTAKAPQTNGQKQAAIDDLFESTKSSSMVVRFEIMIVKVPLLPLHGIQFRRIGGDGWQYQMLARRVLTELKL